MVYTFIVDDVCYVKQCSSSSYYDSSHLLSRRNGLQPSSLFEIQTFVVSVYEIRREKGEGRREEGGGEEGGGEEGRRGGGEDGRMGGWEDGRRRVGLTFDEDCSSS